MANTRKTVATVYVEMDNGNQVDVKTITDAVKNVKGTVKAYVNTAESAVYCVDAENVTTKVEL